MRKHVEALEATEAPGFPPGRFPLREKEMRVIGGRGLSLVGSARNS